MTQFTKSKGEVFKFFFQDSIDSGLVCHYVDTEEFLSIECNCSNPELVVQEGGAFPKCPKEECSLLIELYLDWKDIFNGG